jgi:ribosomal protein L37AE/L43A
MLNIDQPIQCLYCGANVSLGRASLGYKLCMQCGELEASKTKRTVVPFHKSAYMLLTDRTLLKHLNKP